jgi:Fur family transcriptional regulator, peroxide stress response regulator
VRAELQERVDELVQRCREAGMAVTTQRLAIFRALLVAEDHPSPEMLYQRVKKAMPQLSLATIYKTLDSLEALGLVEEVSPVGDVKRYDGNHRPHHHLVCVRCKKVTDFYDDRYATIAPKLQGFVPQALTVQIKGVCAACDRRSRK